MTEWFTLCTEPFHSQTVPPHHLRPCAGAEGFLNYYMALQASAETYQAHLAANGLPAELFEALAEAEAEAGWRAGVWTVYQAVTEALSAATMSPVLSHVDNRVGDWCTDKAVV